MYKVIITKRYEHKMKNFNILLKRTMQLSNNLNRRSNCFKRNRNRFNKGLYLMFLYQDKFWYIMIHNAFCVFMCDRFCHVCLILQNVSQVREETHVLLKLFLLLYLYLMFNGWFYTDNESCQSPPCVPMVANVVSSGYILFMNILFINLVIAMFR